MTVIAELLEVCQREWALFGRQEFDLDGRLVQRGKRETDEGFWQRVGDYWRDGVGRKLTGRDSDVPWSAAFVSRAFKQAGAGTRFPYGASHSRYIRRAIRDRQREVASAPLRGFRLGERPPATGDLVCYARQAGVGFDDQPASDKSHADIVVAVGPAAIEVIGGNVGNSVGKKHLRLGPGGRLADRSQAWFAVLENRL